MNKEEITNQVNEFLDDVALSAYFREQVDLIFDAPVSADTQFRRENAAVIIAKEYKLSIDTAWEIVGHVVIAQQIKYPEVRR